MRERWVRAKAGSGQMIVVSGEAGIGKSRVTRALVNEIAREDHVRLTFQCAPNYSDSAFYPIIQQLTYAAGIHPPDGSSERLDKLERLAGIDASNAALMAIERSSRLTVILNCFRHQSLHTCPRTQHHHGLEYLVLRPPGATLRLVELSLRHTTNSQGKVRHHLTMKKTTADCIREITRPIQFDMHAR